MLNAVAAAALSSKTNDLLYLLCLLLGHIVYFVEGKRYLGESRRVVVVHLLFAH